MRVTAVTCAVASTAESVPGLGPAEGPLHGSDAADTGASVQCPPPWLDLVSIAREHMAAGDSPGAPSAEVGFRALGGGARGGDSSRPSSVAEGPGAARPPLALVVDHGLRAESAAEAAAVAAQARGFGMQVAPEPSVA